MFSDGLIIRLNPRSSGSCQFISVSDQLAAVCGRNINQSDIRQQCVEYLWEHPTFIDDQTHFSQFIDNKHCWQQYLENMRKPTTYGDNITLQVMSKLLNVQFLVVSKKYNEDRFHVITPSPEFDQCIPLLLLGHYDERQSAHYVSLSVCPNSKLATLINSSIPDISVRNKIADSLGIDLKHAVMYSHHLNRSQVNLIKTLFVVQRK